MYAFLYSVFIFTIREAIITVLANSADLDKTAPKEQSDLSLHCLPTVFS